MKKTDPGQKELIDLLKQRQGDRQTASYAREIGISVSLIWSLYNGNRRLGIEASRTIANHFKDDPEMIAALTKYALGIDPNT